MSDPLTTITARSRREAMEWGLVLASQGIVASVDRTESGGWALFLEPKHFDRAQATLRQYRLENRGWQWRQPLPQTGLVFHWGSLGWVAAILAIYYWSEVQYPAAKSAGIMDSEKVRHGQWWRLFTAVTLHENITHLAANATTGFILMGLAMARFGAGTGLLAAFLAGVAGNVAGLFLYTPHLGLGASGMVTGALGMITAQSFFFWRNSLVGRRLLFRAFASGVLLLALIGFSRDSDMVAHVGGFLTGAIFGCALGFVPAERLQRGPANFAAFAAAAGLLFATWRLALHTQT